MSESVRIAGTLVASVLESAGYHYQGVLLDALGDPLKNEIGGLLYLLGIVIAIGTYATSGGYKMGAWLLIGPPLFFATITDRSDVQLTKWQFGDSSRNDSAVTTKAAEIGVSGSASVSTLFARYTELISAVTKEIVAKMTQNRDKVDLRFILQAELFARVHSNREIEVGLQRLFHQALGVECAEVIKWAREANDPLLTRVLNNDPALEGIGEEALAEYAEYYGPIRAKALVQFEREYDQRAVTLDTEAEKYVRQQQLISADSVNSELGQLTLSCHEIWSLALAGIKKRGGRILAQLQRQAEDNGIDPQFIDNLIARSHGKPGAEVGIDGAQYSQDTQMITRIIAQYYLRNEVNGVDRGAWLSHFEQKHNYRHLEVGLMGDASFSEQARVGASEWGEKERLIGAASSIPYYQGLILYALGATFPFFALLLLIPGKHGGFILWFLLWLWAKSWDIGIAAVMLLHDVLFGMLAVGTEAGPEYKKVAAEINSDIGASLTAVQELDPSFQLATFYGVIAVSMLAVPPVMSTLIMGSVKGGADLIAAGKYSEFFGTAMTFLKQGSVVAGLKNRQQQHKMDRAKENVARWLNGDQALFSSQDSLGVQRDTTPVSLSRSRVADSWAGLRDGIVKQYGLQGKLEGLGTSKGTLGRDYKSLLEIEALGDALSVYTGPGAEVAKSQATMLQKLHDQWLDSLINYANWDADVDRESLVIHDMIGLYGGITVPWSQASEESSAQDFKLELLAFEMEQERALLALKSINKVAGTADKYTGKLLETFSGSMFDEKTRKRISVFAKIGLGVAAASDSATREATIEAAKEIGEELIDPKDTKPDEMHDVFEAPTEGINPDLGRVSPDVHRMLMDEKKKRAPEKSE